MNGRNDTREVHDCCDCVSLQRSGIIARAVQADDAANAMQSATQSTTQSFAAAHMMP
jgi:hypothetical protein